MTAVTYTLPIPPSMNRMWRFVPGASRPKLSEQIRSWKSGAGNEIRAQGIVRFDGPVLVFCEFHRARKDMDCDNRIKPIPDLLAEVGIIPNDKVVAGGAYGWAPISPKSCQVTVMDAQRVLVEWVPAPDRSIGSWRRLPEKNGPLAGEPS